MPVKVESEPLLQGSPEMVVLDTARCHLPVAQILAYLLTVDLFVSMLPAAATLI